MEMISSLIPHDNTLRKPVIAIKESEKDQIKKAIDTWGEQAKEAKSHKSVDFIVERDKLLIEWLFNTGMRISDALSIKFRDVNMRNEGVRLWSKSGQGPSPSFIR